MNKIIINSIILINFPIGIIVKEAISIIITAMVFLIIFIFNNKHFS